MVGLLVARLYRAVLGFEDAADDTRREHAGGGPRDLATGAGLVAYLGIAVAGSKFSSHLSRGYFH